MGACKHAFHKLTFFSIYYSGFAASPPWRASYPWLQSDLKGKGGSKLLGDSISAFSAGNWGKGACAGRKRPEVGVRGGLA